MMNLFNSDKKEQCHDEELSTKSAIVRQESETNEDQDRGSKSDELPLSHASMCVWQLDKEA